MENFNNYDIQQTWNKLIVEVKNLDKENIQKVDAFFPLIKPQAISNGYLLITANNSFIKFWIEKNFLNLIEQGLFNIFNTKFEVEIVIDETHTNQNNQPTINYNQPITPQTTNTSYVAANLVASNTDPTKIFQNTTNEFPKPNSLMSKLTFENFVIGQSNNLAYRMAQTVAATPGKSNLNPLFIYGRSGVGKTHLLSAIKNYLQEHNPQINVLYVDAQDFLDDFTSAASAHDADKSSFINFRNKYENTNVLLIDDLQLLQNKTQTLNSFFSIFNTITNSGRQIVISADRAPKNIDVDERYQSRFNNGMLCEISAPEIELKLGIIKAFIDEFIEDDPQNNINIQHLISNDVKNYIAENSSSNIRELKSSINKILFEIQDTKQKITLSRVKELLEDHFSKSLKKRISINNIQSASEKFFKVSHSDLLSKKKDRNISNARQIAMYLVFDMMDITISEIGKEFGRDHSTVLYSINSIKEKLKTNRNIQEEIEVLKKIILEG